MEDLELQLEEVVKKMKRKDTISAVLISSAFLIFGLLVLILLDIIIVSQAIRDWLSILLLILTWILMVTGIHLLVSMPVPKLPPRIVADSKGIIELMQKKYPGKVYVTRDTFKKIPPTAGMTLKIEVIEIDEEESAKNYAKYGKELAQAIAAAKKLRGKIVSNERKKIDGVEILRAEDLK